MKVVGNAVADAWVGLGVREPDVTDLLGLRDQVVDLVPAGGDVRAVAFGAGFEDAKGLAQRLTPVEGRVEPGIRLVGERRVDHARRI